MENVEFVSEKVRVVFERCPDCGAVHLPGASRCRGCLRPLKPGVAWPGESWLYRPQVRISDFMLLVIGVALYVSIAKIVPYASAVAVCFLGVPGPFVLVLVCDLKRRGRPIDSLSIFRIYLRLSGLLWVSVSGIGLIVIWLGVLLAWIGGVEFEQQVRLLVWGPDG
jgi:hypothetical protein